jgi:hypothetical protein
MEPYNIYNMDETCFILGVLTRSKRVFSRRLYEEGKIKAHSLVYDAPWYQPLIYPNEGITHLLRTRKWECGATYGK